MKKHILLFTLMLSTIVSVFAADPYVKTGYFTSFYAREHVSDMPREFFMLFEEDGTMVPLSFHEHKSTGAYSIWNFDPRDFLGKTVTIDFTANLNYNNNEFPIQEGSSVTLIPRLWIHTINSFTEADKTISAPAQYQYPQTDTLLIPHDVVVANENYEDKSPTQIVNLTDYVVGSGTESRPYQSADGFAGLKAAINALPNGGIIEVPSGIYKATSKKLTIPRYVSIKGVGETKPYFILADERMWYLKGSNTIDNIDVDMSQINRNYTHEVIAIHNNAKYVTIKNSKFIGNYKVDPANNYSETGNTVMFRFYSHLKDITFENDTFIKPLRSIASKGQRNQHNVTFRECLFEGQGQMCITYDQTSNMSNFIVENNKFIEFSHFGIALARINDVIIRNNTFYSRNLESFNTYNQAIHIEEHTQNILIEDNVIDVTLRNSGSGDPSSTVRSYGIIAMDARHLTIKNNDIKYNSVNFGAGSATHVGYSKFINNRLEDGALLIRDANKGILVKDNEFVNPPDYAMHFYSVKPMLQEFGWHNIESNLFTKMEGKQPFYIRGEVKDMSITNNTFEGCDQKASYLEPYAKSTKWTISGNKFHGISAENAFELKGSLPSGNTLSEYKADNMFSTQCSGLSVDELSKNEIQTIYPNPVNTGEIVTIGTADLDIDFTVYNSNGAIVSRGNGNLVNTSNLKSGLYFIRKQFLNTISIEKLVVK